MVNWHQVVPITAWGLLLQLAPGREFLRRMPATRGCPGFTQDKRKERNMAQDPVCGLEVDPKRAAATSEYQGKSFVFCSAACKNKFDSKPHQYTGK